MGPTIGGGGESPSQREPRVAAVARRWVCLVAAIVPADRRREWMDEWQAELCEVVQEARQLPARRGSAWAAALVLALGSLRHALGERLSAWSLDQLGQDLRYAIRALLRARSYSVVSVLTLGAGIGVNAVIFTMMDHLLLRPPPAIAEPDRLVQIGRGHVPEAFDRYSYPYYRDLRDGDLSAFSGVAAYAEAAVVVGSGSDSDAIPAQVVSANYFQVLGVPPALGRGFSELDDRPGSGEDVVVLSDALWRQRFGGSPSVVGRELVINGRPFLVAGVASQTFRGATVLGEAPLLWLPLSRQRLATGRSDETAMHRGDNWLWVVARLAGGVTAEAAAAETATFLRSVDEAEPAFGGQGVQVVSGIGARPADRGTVSALLNLLGAMAVVVLLIACGNVAGLALARGAARRRDIAIRVALGASGSRVARQLLAEAVILSLGGATLALALAAFTTAYVPMLLPEAVAVDFRVDLRIAGFSLAAALVAAVGFGALPALTLAGADPGRAIGRLSIRGVSAAAPLLRRALVAGQVALSFVLLVAAGLLGQSVRNARDSDPGFRTTDVVIVTIDPERSGMDTEERDALLAALDRNLSVLPGVHAVGLGRALPVVDFQPSRTPLVDDGFPPPAGEPPPRPVYLNTVDAGYFTALGIPLLRGRLFDPALDRNRNPAVAVVSRSFADRFWPGDDPIGKPLPFGERDQRARVIGVVADARTRSLRESPPATAFLPFGNGHEGPLSLVIWAEGPPSAVLMRIAASIEALHPGLPILRKGALQDLVGRSLRDTWTVGVLSVAFGFLAALLAVIGLYGVVAQSVALRVREFAVRLALGARRGDVLGLVLRQALVLTLAGILAGLTLAFGMERILGGLLYGVGTGDLETLTAAGALLFAAAIAAAIPPARSATRSEPARLFHDS